MGRVGRFVEGKKMCGGVCAIKLEILHRLLELPSLKLVRSTHNFEQCGYAALWYEKGGQG